MGGIAKAEELAGKILQMTKQVSLTGEPSKVEDEVTAYVELIEKRSPLVTELLELGLSEAARSSSEYAPVKEAIAEIAMLDRANMEIVQEMHETVRDAIKLTKQGQRLSKGYQASHHEAVSSGFDVKQ